MTRLSEGSPSGRNRPARPRYVDALLWVVAALLLAAVVWAALYLSGVADATRSLVIVAWVVIASNFALRIWMRRVSRNKDAR